MITPCFRVTAVDDTGVEHEGVPDSSSYSPAYEALAPSGSRPRCRRRHNSSA